LDEATAARGLVAAAEDFARQAHAGQTRKGARREPYVEHLAEVAVLTRAFGGDDRAVAAAWLHDAVEDCDVAPATLEARFGAEVAGLVVELTDDKTLDKAARKRAQVERAPMKSPAACLIKLADKTSNLRALALSPPADWDHARRAAYVQWGVAVVAGLPHRPPAALATFLDAVDAAERANARNGLPPEAAARVEAAVAAREARRTADGVDAVLAALAQRGWA
jgi:(p)ppGpp synthase/HD superfamily hydrolase